MEGVLKSKRFVGYAVLTMILWTLTGCGTSGSDPRISGRETRLYEKPRIVTPTPRPVPKPQVAPSKPVCPQSTPLKGTRIIVDPGHGGHDPGAGQVGYSQLPEKTIVLDIGMHIAQQLKSCGADVIMTRSGDQFISLDSRAASAEQNRASLLISVHADSAPNNTNATGPTIYIAHNASRTSIKVAQQIDKSLKNAGFPSRGIRRADFRVLAKHSRPAVLVECGFLTNYSDASRLNSPWYRKKIAHVIVDGINGSLGYGK